MLVLGIGTPPALAQTPANVRVAIPMAQILTRPSADADVISSSGAGTILDVVDADKDWYWIALPADRSGTRRRGWVRAGDVQAVNASDVNQVIRELNDKVEQLQQQVQGLQATPRPAASSMIPPSAADVMRIEKAKHEKELRQREYDEAVAQQAAQIGGRGTTQMPSSRTRNSAAPRQYELFGGYSLFRDQTESLTFPMGWIASLSRSVNDSMALVGQASGSYKRLDVLGVNVVNANIHTFTAGPQFSRRTGRVTSFAQLLGGLSIRSESSYGSSSQSSMGFALTPGLGVEVPVARRLGVRVGGELGLVRDSLGWTNGLRLTTGLVVRGSQQ
jgi:hypothetical protein